MEREIITSRQNPLVKTVCALMAKKNRANEGLFRFDGKKLLCEALSAGVQIRWIICRTPVGEDIEKIISDAVRENRIQPSRLVYVSEGVFEKMSEESSPEGVICVAHFLSDIHKKCDALPSGRILIAESLRDPGNLGTVMRSAYALGIDMLILTDDCADIYNPKVLRAAMGAVFKLRTASLPQRELADFILQLRESGRRVYAAALKADAKKIGDIALTKGDCFVVGNEGHGLSQSTVAACTDAVIIPMREDAESLNAAAAAVICIWETVKV